MDEPSARVRTPLGVPSTNADDADPSRTAFQSASVPRSAIARSSAASAAYTPSCALRKFAAMSASDDVVRTSAAPSADISNIAMSATMIAICIHWLGDQPYLLLLF